MLKIIALIVAVVVIGFLAFAATRPDSFRVQRSIVISAPPETIFPLIDDLHDFSLWSPYDKRDPAMKRDYSGAASGKGAAYAWDGNKEVGSGRMEIIESSPSTKVLMHLDFFRPFKARNTAEFTLQPREGSTEVSWAMYGPSPYISKVMGLVFNMDRMIGSDFEAGLLKLKTIAEAR